MVTTPAHARPATGVLARARRAWRASSARLTWQQWLVVVIAATGAGVLQYPDAAAWFTARVQAGQVASYGESVERLPSHESEALLREAHAYNDWLPRGPLRDPFRPDGVVQETAVGDYVAEYYTKLAVPGVEAMAHLSIPEIGVDLPVLHGTDPEALTRGVGHIFGSSLPVGGEGTHSVLTAHSGYVHATLFDRLHELEQGDTFSIHVLGEDLTYAVDQILEVLPHEAESLSVVDGQDHVTLVTCTPIGVNTHRLLVRGVRVETPAASGTQDVAAPTVAGGPGVPWWALVVVGSGTLAYGAVRLAVPGPRPGGR